MLEITGMEKWWKTLTSTSWPSKLGLDEIFPSSISTSLSLCTPTFLLITHIMRKKMALKESTHLHSLTHSIDLNSSWDTTSRGGQSTWRITWTALFGAEGIFFMDSSTPNCVSRVEPASLFSYMRMDNVGNKSTLQVDCWHKLMRRKSDGT